MAPLSFRGHVEGLLLLDVSAEEQEGDKVILADVGEPLEEGAQVEADHILEIYLCGLSYWRDISKLMNRSVLCVNEMCRSHLVRFEDLVEARDDVER